MNTPENASTPTNLDIAPHSECVLASVATMEEATMDTASQMGSSIRLPERNFPEKLHYVLTELERQGKTHIAAFLPHGRAFKVFRHEEFIEVLGRWFRQTKYASFQRQLNIYGFTRITAGPDFNASYHEFFLRGRPELTKCIHRTPVKGQRRRDVDMTFPNFYTMAPLSTVAVSNMEANGGDATYRQLKKESLHCSPTPFDVAQERRQKSCVPVSIKKYTPGGNGPDGTRSLADDVLAISQRRQLSDDVTAHTPSPSLTTKAIVMESIARRQQQQRQELRQQLERRLVEEQHGGPHLPSVLRAALFSLRNSTL